MIYFSYSDPKTEISYFFEYRKNLLINPERIYRCMGVCTREGSLYSGCKLGCIFLECIFGEVYIRDGGWGAGGGGGLTGFRNIFILKKKSLFFLDSLKTKILTPFIETNVKVYYILIKQKLWSTL